MEEDLTDVVEDEWLKFAINKTVAGKGQAPKVRIRGYVDIKFSSDNVEVILD